MPEVKLKTRKNKEKFMESVGWAVSTDCKEVKGLKEGFQLYKCVSPSASIHAPCLTGLDISKWC